MTSPPLTDAAILDLARAHGLDRAAALFPAEVVAAARSVELLRQEVTRPIDPELAP